MCCGSSSRDVDVAFGPAILARRVRRGDAGLGDRTCGAAPGELVRGAFTARQARARGRLRRGHEARLVAAAGADVVAIDFAPEAIAAARLIAANEGVAIEFRLRDLFALGHERERYGLVVEHCCFCAIDPARRGEYVERVAGALEEGGDYVGLLRTRCTKPVGPPFAVDRDEVERLFAPHFSILEMRVPDDSIQSRRGAELFVHMTRR